MILQCRHFGACGSCGLFEMGYEEQLKSKVTRVSRLLEPFYGDDLEIFSSPDSHYRARAEFRIWHEGEQCSYAMGTLDRKGAVSIMECPKVIEPIERRMWDLLESINANKELSHRLFSIEFLATTTDACLVTMIYHRRLTEDWISQAKVLESRHAISVIGRSRKQKELLSEEYATEMLSIDGSVYSYRYYEGGFTQPNPTVNVKMIEWAKKHAATANSGDLLESYCGLGNFTLPLSKLFTNVLATEISKSSIKAALENCALNSIENITFVRLSSEEMTEALERKREFRRLAEVDLDSYDFSCVLVDPPRAGLDKATITLISGIEHILYISCNPETLARDLQILTQTHTVADAALFDQFPHTSHVESGVFLVKRQRATA